MKLLNDLLHPRHSSQSSVNFEFSRKTAHLAARLLLSCARDLLQRGRICSFLTVDCEQSLIFLCKVTARET